MGSFSLMHWVVVLIVVMLLFGGGRISSMMGDVAKGIKNFKKGLSDDDEATPPPPAQQPPRIDAQPASTIDNQPAAAPAQRDQHKQDS